jgi:EAL domain-containing protein (putative c-di-GMP-specific phosphodiesterase class I)
MAGRRRWSTRARARAVRRGRDALRVVVQPICQLASGETVGYEALSRFPGVSPDKLFAEAQGVGLGLELEMHAVARAVEQFTDRGPYLSVNVSPLSLASPRFAEFILGVDVPRPLVLELTEHTPVGDYDELCLAVQRLREGGLRIAVDDAGGGVSSFRHILMLAPEIIKLDRSLIANLDVHPGRQALADLLVKFAERMGADLVAEGIERPEELEACRSHGIRYGQGYLLGRPVPAPEALGSDPSTSHGPSRQCAASPVP